MEEFVPKYVSTRKIAALPCGDEIFHYHKSIAVIFQGRRKVLATSLFNGGYRDDLVAVFNSDCKDDEAEIHNAPFLRYMEKLAAKLGFAGNKAAGMITAADMECAAVASESHGDLTVTAIVTAGIEQNGGRVGDPADYYRPIKKDAGGQEGISPSPKLGTINIILHFNCDLPESIMARALVTCTEAKTAAIQELLDGSKYSWGLATGSGTDETAIIADAEAPLLFDAAGKHSKPGELIGKAVMRAVKSALAKQSGLTPLYQHDAFRRLKRFGITDEKIYCIFCQNFTQAATETLKPRFLLAAAETARTDAVATYTSLYVHLIDQFLWDLLGAAETATAGGKILGLLAGNETPPQFGKNLNDKTAFVEEMLAAWENVFVKLVAHNIKETK